MNETSLPALINLIKLLSQGFIIAALVAPPLLMLLIARHKKWHGIVRTILLLLVAGGYTFWIAVPFYQMYDSAKKEKMVLEAQEAKAAAYQKEAYAYFHKKCAEVGRW